jgi:hypothetical protein
MENFINVALSIIAVVVTFLSYYLAIKNKIEKTAKDAINAVEDFELIGEEKMQIAVEQVYNVIPLMMKPVFPKEFIEQIIQGVFDKMAEFAAKQVEEEHNKNGD